MASGQVLPALRCVFTLSPRRRRLCFQQHYSACLFVGRIVQKLLDWFSRNSVERCGPRKKWLDFGGNPDHVTFGLGFWLGSWLQSSHASWKVLEFFLENSRTWKVLENHFDPGKSWKLKLKVLESPGKISLEVMHFSSGSNGKQAAIV